MHVKSIDELYDRLEDYLPPVGKCLSFSSGESAVQIMLYGEAVFEVFLPQAPATTLSIVQNISEAVAVTTFLGTDLSAIQNTGDDFEAALDVIVAYQKLQLPEKFLAAYAEYAAVESEYLTVHAEAHNESNNHPVATLPELRSQVERFFQHKAQYLSTHPDESDTDRGYVTFLLYEALVFSFAVMDPPYASLAMTLDVNEQYTSHVLLGKKLLFVEQTELAAHAAFDVVNQYCRLRLPDKLLDEIDALSDAAPLPDTIQE